MTYPNLERPAGALKPAELTSAWRLLSPEDRVAGFRLLGSAESDEFFLELSSPDQAELILGLPPNERTAWMRMLAPDDAADVIQRAPAAERDALLALLDAPSRSEVLGLLAYAEDDAGGLMNPRYARVRPEMTVDEAISYLRKQARTRLETLYYVYVLDALQRLLGVVSFRQLFAAAPDKRVREVMRADLVTVPEHMHQEEVSKLFAAHDVIALPVVDAEGRMKGIVTVDDIVDVVEEEATEDIQKLGGMEALDGPYLKTGLGRMLRKRAGWLAILFFGEMLTATAMGYFESEISRALVLALFIPLIISSGGNSGSQASTLVVRALALGELRLSDWLRVVRRELVAGLALGAILAAVGFARIVAWRALFGAYGDEFMRVAVTVAASLLGVVMFGTLAGSMLPLLLRRLGFDPASASAPLVATMVDVTGLVIYFTVASFVLL
jgi:magnesium transporter